MQPFFVSSVKYNMDDNREYTEVILPFIVQNYDLENPKASLVEIIDFIENVEYAASLSERVANQILYVYYVVHLN